MEAGTDSWRGLGVSPGRAAGRVWVLQGLALESACDDDRDVEVSQELASLEVAIEATAQRLGQLEQQVRTEQGEEAAQIFFAHKQLLTDPAFIGEARERIESRGLSASRALKEVAAEAVEMLRNIPDPYFQERAVDVQDVLAHLLRGLPGFRDSGGPPFPDADSWVVVAEELTPAQTVSLPKDRVLGFIVRNGCYTSHAAILARTYGIPAVAGIGGEWEQLLETEWVELDGDGGWVRQSPEGVTSSKCDEVCEQDASIGDVDGNMTLSANLGCPDDLPLVKKFGAQGVGLYRTEFLFMGQELPTEQEQVDAYKAVIEACTPNLTVIRTLDIGGDKAAPALGLPKEQNSFLGVRGLRLCLRRPELFRVQLRAIWRASSAGRSAVMFPMVATLEELAQTKELLFSARDEVVREGNAVGEIEIGMMIEVPAAAWNAKCFAGQVDFFSIGTNDLTQYMLAANRESAELSDLYQPHNPAVLGMIARVNQAAKDAGIWVGVCGEAGGDSLLTPFFAALGVDELSMAPGSLPKVRQTLARLTFGDVEKQELVDAVLGCSTAAEVTASLKEFSHRCASASS